MTDSDRIAELERLLLEKENQIAQQNAQLADLQNNENGATGTNSKKRQKKRTIDDLAVENRLDAGKLTLVSKCVRMKLWKKLKYVTEETKSWAMKKLFTILGIKTALDKRQFEDHIEMELQRKITVRRNNTIKNIKDSYIKSALRNENGKIDNSCGIVV